MASFDSSSLTAKIGEGVRVSHRRKGEKLITIHSRFETPLLEGLNVIRHFIYHILSD